MDSVNPIRKEATGLNVNKFHLTYILSAYYVQDIGTVNKICKMQLLYFQGDGTIVVTK